MVHSVKDAVLDDQWLVDVVIKKSICDKIEKKNKKFKTILVKKF